MRYKKWRLEITYWPAEVLPLWEIRLPIPVLVKQRTIDINPKDIKPVRTPRHHGRRRSEMAAKVFPLRPGVFVEVPVHVLTFVRTTNNVKPTRPPGSGCHLADKVASEILSLVAFRLPAAAVPVFVGRHALFVNSKEVDSVFSPCHRGRGSFKGTCEVFEVAMWFKALRNMVLVPLGLIRCSTEYVETLMAPGYNRQGRVARSVNDLSSGFSFPHIKCVH